MINFRDLPLISTYPYYKHNSILVVQSLLISFLNDEKKGELELTKYHVSVNDIAEMVLALNEDANPEYEFLTDEVWATMVIENYTLELYLSTLDGELKLFKKK